jgi:MFS family permease
MIGRTEQSESRTGRMVILGSLYFSQGLPYGFFVQALPVLLRKQGFSLEQIGLASMLATPWALKFLWSPAVDRYSWNALGHRKSWIIPAQILSALTLVWLAFLPWTTEMKVVLAGVFLSNLLTATQDIATDGLSVDVMKPHERGAANGLKVAGYRGGMIIGGGALLAVYDRIDWKGTYLAMAALIVVASLPVLFLREPERATAAHVVRERAHSHFLRRAGAGRVLFILVTYKLGDAFSTGMLRPFFADLGLSLSDVGWLVGTVGFVAGLIGAVAGGALVNTLGRRRALVTFGFLQAVAVAGYGGIALARPGQGWLAIIIAAEHFASGMATAALFTCMMDWCSKETSATDYSVQASTVVIATGFATTFSGFSAGRLGYIGHFGASTVLAIISLLVVARWFPDPRTIAGVTGSQKDMSVEPASVRGVAF